MQTNIIRQNHEDNNPQIIDTLKPCNEKQELKYLESITGTLQAIIKKSDEIIKGLNSVLKNGEFSFKIESFDLTDALYLDSHNLFDVDFNIIGKLENIRNG